MSNRVTLAQLDKMSVTQAVALPIDQLACLLEDVATEKARVDSYEKKLDKVMEARFAEPAQAMREDAGKNTGTVRFDDGDFTVVADLPKKVAWNQAKLRDAIETIRDWSEDPAFYIKTEHSVEERKFLAWPPAIQDVFVPARTVGTGKPRFKLERRAA